MFYLVVKLNIVDDRNVNIFYRNWFYYCNIWLLVWILKEILFLLFIILVFEYLRKKIKICFIFDNEVFVVVMVILEFYICVFLIIVLILKV